MKKAHSLGTHFSYNNRHEKLISFRMQVKERVHPEIRIKVDLNTTRNAAHHNLLHPELQLNRLLRVYMSVHNDTPQMTDAEWDSIA